MQAHDDADVYKPVIEVSETEEERCLVFRGH